MITLHCNLTDVKAEIWMSELTNIFNGQVWKWLLCAFILAVKIIEFKYYALSMSEEKLKISWEENREENDKKKFYADFLNLCSPYLNLFAFNSISTVYPLASGRRRLRLV